MSRDRRYLPMLGALDQISTPGSPASHVGSAEGEAKPHFRKMLGAALRLLGGLWIRSCFSNESLSAEWNCSISLSFWCFHPVFLTSARHFLREWGQARSPSVWVQAAPASADTAGLRRCLREPAFTCWEVGEGSLLKFLSIQMDMKQWLGQLSAFLSTCLSKKGEGRCLPVGVDSFQSTWFKVEHSQAFQTLLFWMS